MKYRLRFLAVAIALAGLAMAPSQVQAQSETQTATTQQAMTPDQALERLMAGNLRYVERGMVQRDLIDQVGETAAGQFPYAVVLGCIDSRVPPEMLFDQGIGDIFSARVAGNFVNTDILGSMEFATAAAGSKLIVVLGHTECGAVKGACDHVELGNLTHTLSNISPAVYATEMEGTRDSSNKEFVDAVVHTNVDMTVDNILQRSDIIRGQVERGEVKVVGAVYDVASGMVTLMDDHAGH